MNTGWEVCPLDWLLLAPIGGVVFYYAVPLRMILRHARSCFNS